MPQEGLLLQLDGSRHDWLQGRAPWLTLLAAIDDATGRIVAATFRDAEDTAGYLEILRETVRQNGIPAAIYRDRHGAFEPTNGARLTVEQRRTATHVGAALESLGIRSIAAGSPQAKGRIERAWGTEQDRLVLVLRLAGACDRDAANAILARYLAARNRRFSVPARQPEPAWRTVPGGTDLDAVFAFHYERLVGNDHTIRIAGLALQLPPLAGGGGYARRRVDVQVRLDGRIVVADRGTVLLATEPLLDAARLRDPETPDATPLASDLAPRAINRAGFDPPADHPWRHTPTRRTQPRGLTDSVIS